MSNNLSAPPEKTLSGWWIEKSQPTTLKHLTKNNTEATNKKDIEDTTSWDLFSKFISQQLQLTISYL